MKSLKPIAEEITSWTPCKEIIYKCPVCGQSFRALGQKIKFCYNCGTKINWNGVIINLPESFDKNNEEEERKLIAAINKKQQENIKWTD